MTIKFSQLWEAHPGVNGDADPCRRPDGHKAFDDQCAIRLGVALTRCGYDVSRLKLAQCWYHPKTDGHVLRAEELAKALKRTAIPGVFGAVKVSTENFEKTLRGQTGIIFFKDYFRRDSESFTNRSGDHIDLWNGERVTSRSSYLRIQWGLHWEGYLSDFFNSREIWFWKII
ncbi:T6SS effector amidase Tae4 family protein [Cronobacter dublinensis]|uniref:T6SS effector amidase Tae4 family protein n=1 Tax=Cronobacter dublinensis TaxID=413497 RepID=UPI0018F8934D|nr:T6SS effector amidase Tae4 family protein [Cronobacter dublinensis]MDI7491954.1 T6SS effector amidase Tae4 family protein [Cronobacter dublinensis]MDK1193944.1 T6SS effector amidase Tae4 family protein [Cronobacter dublinensis]MDK1199733.1 T6SS effector amidase Tae4 family protein [Cronobacter dublinensis]